MLPLYHESFPNDPGIYLITCLPTGKIYVGSAINLRHRRKTHYGYLQRNEHRNPKLQAAWNKYGAENFTFKILELVLTPELLTAREQFYLDTLKPWDKRGFNIGRIADSSLGQKRSPEARKNIGDAQRGKARPERRGVKSSLTTEQHKLNHASQTRTIIAIDPDGVEHLVTGIKAFCQERGLNCTSMMRVAQGKLKSHKDWIARFPEGAKQEYPTNKSYEHKGHSDATREKIQSASLGHAPTFVRAYIVTSPDGAEYIVQDGLPAFCKQHGLNSSCLGGIARGERKQHKGWTARYLDANAS